LLGILVGEQILPLGKHLMRGAGIERAWKQAECAPHLSDFSSAVAEQEHFGFRPGWEWAAVAIAVELVGSLLVITGRMVWLGAGALGVLTPLAAFAASPFWTMQGQARFMAHQYLL
jgi:uncharacterized membrane protein YphA (DoxX/SURF4 family)